MLQITINKYTGMFIFVVIVTFFYGLSQGQIDLNFYIV